MTYEEAIAHDLFPAFSQWYDDDHGCTTPQCVCTWMPYFQAFIAGAESVINAFDK